MTLVKINKTKKRVYSRNKSPNYVAEKQISNIYINNKRNKQTKTSEQREKVNMWKLWEVFCIFTINQTYTKTKEI